MSACDDKPACEETDTCYKAVTNAYRQLKLRGERDEVCFHSAVAVYRHYHPEVAPSQAPYVIADWVE